MTKVIRTTPTTASVVTAKMAKPTAPAGTLTSNRAGGVAYVAPQRDSVLSYLMTGGTGRSYYATVDEHENTADELFRAAAATDSEYLAKAIVYARQQGFMRSMPIRALAFLSTSQEREAKTLFRQAFRKTIQTPGDLADFLSLTRGEKRVRGNGRAIREAAGEWLSGISPYHVIKYGSDKQTMSLRDMYRLAHPTLTSDEQQAVARYVVKGDISSENRSQLPSQLRGYIDFKNATDTVPNLLAMVAEHRLPWEVVSGQLGGGDTDEKKLVWTAMSEQMPYMALLRNLRNLATNGVLDDKATRERILGTIANPDRVRSSKQFPFRFISAYRSMQASFTSSHQHAVLAALSDALDASVGNMPALGRTLVSLDVSGSMSAPVAGQRGSDPISAFDVASVFAAAIYKGSEFPTVHTFDSVARDVTAKLRRDSSVLEISKQIPNNGGATSLGAAIKLALSSGQQYDTLVFLTDSESWVNEVAYGNRWGANYSRNGVVTASQALLTEYQQKYPETQVFFLQLIPTYTRQTEPDMANVFYTYGWSDSVLRYISYQHSGVTQLHDIMELDIAR